ncbi:MAG: DNA cytosine methyltransferase [Chloroflexi bacterium]|nr:DNA cytosine methyltransferase [Chloroflexota bacterium]
MIAIDLFCGVGGMSLGFERAGFEVLAAFDFERRHVEAYQYNFHQTQVIKADIRDLTATNILEVCNTKQQIDVIFGGPPCQGFSVAGRGLVADERNSLLSEFARIVCEIRPKAFVIENVRGILAEKYRNILSQFHDTLATVGYRFIPTPWTLDAANYGVPQRRKRVFFVGVLENNKLPILPEPSIATHNNIVLPTVEDAISDLPELEEIEYLFNSDRYFGELGNPSLYSARLREPNLDLTEARKQKFSFAGLGGCSRTIHAEAIRQRFKSTLPGASEPISRFYKLDWKGLAPTLRAGTPSSHGQHMAARPIHPEEPRCITIREAARLHSFPDWFEFYPTKWYGFMQIGNSVPPLLAEAVAASLKSVL